jgi:hypothetical protein
MHGCLAGKTQDVLEDVYWKRIRRTKEAFSLHRLGAFGSEIAVLSAFFDPPWEQLAPGLNEPAQAFVLNAAGFALRALGRLPEAERLLRLSLEQCIAQEDWKNAAASASNLERCSGGVGTPFVIHPLSSPVSHLPSACACASFVSVHVHAPDPGPEPPRSAETRPSPRAVGAPGTAASRTPATCSPPSRASSSLRSSSRILPCSRSGI